MNDSMVIMRQSGHNKIGFFCYTSQLEPKNVEETGGDEYWTTALQEQLNQFIRNDVLDLVLKPKDKNRIGTKWILKNKQDENEIIGMNKARLVV